MLTAMGESREKMPGTSGNRRRQGWLRPIAIWTLNLALFVSIYVMFAKRPAIAGALEVIGVCIGIFLIIVGVGTGFALRRSRRAQAELNDANAALARGQLEVACETFTRW